MAIRTRLALVAVGALAASLLVLVGAPQAGGDEAVDATVRRATAIATGGSHTCALLDTGDVRCWGVGSDGRLGSGNLLSIGDDETPGSVRPVDLGEGRTATAIVAGVDHSCALLDTGDVTCWGSGQNGKLGYANTNNIGDNEAPASAGAVDLGEGRTATAIATGGSHTCALLDTGDVRCWGRGIEGQLGSGSTTTIGDDETPGAVGPVDLGEGRTATAIAAGNDHSCALLDTGDLRCWGNNFQGQLGYGNQLNIGDDETPGSVGPVDLGDGRTATAITTGSAHTCVIRDDGAVACWGDGGAGRTGYGTTVNLGDHAGETPAFLGPVNIGATATAVTAGFHTCAILDTGAVRCWGAAHEGQLGYAHLNPLEPPHAVNNIGDNEHPAAMGPVDLGVGRTATAIHAGGQHTCAILDTSALHCWGNGEDGQLGYANHDDVGDHEHPGTVGPVDLGSSPSAPTDVTATAEGSTSEATIAWSAPTDDGGAAITGYTVAVSPSTGVTGDTRRTTTDGSPATFTGLSTGIAYTFTVTANSTAGRGVTSAATVPLTLTAPTTTTTTTTTAAPSVQPPATTTRTQSPTTTVPSSTTTTVTPRPPAPPPLPPAGTGPVFVADDDAVPVDGSEDDDDTAVVAVVAVSPTGTLAVTSTGRVIASDDGDFRGELPEDLTLNAPITSIAPHWTWDPTKTAKADGAWVATGYWLLGADGGVFAFGTARFHGSTGSNRPIDPVVSLAPTPSGRGYWLTTRTGEAFAFGDAESHGDTSDLRLNAPIVAVTATPDGDGYWLAAADGGVFTFGAARFHGSGAHTGHTYIGIAPTSTGRGYWLVTTEGSLEAYGDAG